MGRFFRWVPKQHAAAALRMGLVSHNTSATWIFDMSAGYRPGADISRNAILLAYDLDDTATLNVKQREHLDFEDGAFVGEAAHPTKILVKNNEIGAYGLGKMRQHITNKHATASYATKKEVAKALGLKEIEVADGYKPPTGWP